MYINSPEFIDFVHIINLACKFKKKIYNPKNQEKVVYHTERIFSHAKYIPPCTFIAILHLKECSMQN